MVAPLVQPDYSFAATVMVAATALRRAARWNPSGASDVKRSLSATQ